MLIPTSSDSEADLLIVDGQIAPQTSEPPRPGRGRSPSAMQQRRGRRRLSFGQVRALIVHYAAEGSTSAGSGGGSCAAASQTAAAVRIARSRATPAPTPVAIAQINASTKDALRSAGTFGGVDPLSVLQRTSKSRWVASAASDPTPMLTPFQPYFLTICTLGSYPDHVCPHRRRKSRHVRKSGARRRHSSHMDAGIAGFSPASIPST